MDGDLPTNGNLNSRFILLSTEEKIKEISVFPEAGTITSNVSDVYFDSTIYFGASVFTGEER